MADNRITMLCAHCGNVTAFTTAAEGSQPSTISTPQGETTTWTTWRIQLCSICLQPTLERDTQVVEGPIGAKPPRGSAPLILYPAAQTRMSSLPPTIARMYQETTRVERKSPRACAVMAGLTLEAICQQEGANGNSLVERLHQLVGGERIPKTLAEIVPRIKQFHTIGDHLADEEIVPDDLRLLLDFIAALLEYLYIAPATIRSVQERLGKT